MEVSDCLGKMNNFKNKELSYAEFNQDQSCIIYTYNNEFSVWDCENLQVRFMRVFKRSIGKASALYKTNIVLISGDKDIDNPLIGPNSVFIWDDNNIKFIAELGFDDNVTNIKLLKKFIIIALKDEIYLYELNNLKEIESFETYENQNGLCAVAETDKNTDDFDNSEIKSTISFLGKEIGEIIVLHLTNDENTEMVTIQAHQSEIVCLNLNKDGTLLATASSRGTLIRVFDTKTGELKFEFRRGTTTNRINNLFFNHSGTLLAATSEKGTVHIYKLREDTQNKYYLKTMGFSGLDYCDARFYISECNSKFIASFDRNTNDIIVLLLNGVCYRYTLNSETVELPEVLEYHNSETIRVIPRQ